MSNLIICRGCNTANNCNILLSCLHSYCNSCLQDNISGSGMKQVYCLTCNKYSNVSVKQSPPGLTDHVTSSWCTEHKEEPWVMYCFTCSRPICELCLRGEHKTHECYTLTESSKIRRYDLQTYLRNFEENIAPLRNAINDVVLAKENIRKNTQMVVNQIKNNFEKLLQTLKDRENELIKEAEDIQKAKLKVLELQENDLESELTNTIDVCLFTDKLIKQSNEVAIICAHDAIVKKMAQLRQNGSSRKVLEADDTLFTPKSCDLYLKATANLGRVDGQRKTFASMSRLENLPDTVICGSRVSLLLSSCDAVGNVVANTGDQITSLVEYKTSRNRCKVTIRNKDKGTFQITFTPQEVDTISLSVGINGRHIEGSPYNLNCAQKRDYALLGECLKVNGKKGRQIGELFHPTSICLNKAEDKIFISDSDNHRIQVWLYPDFVPHSTFGSEGKNPGEFSYPYGICGHNNSIIVADCKNHRIQVLSDEGKVLLVFGEHGSQLGKLSHPYDVKVDQKKRILVSDSANHRVQIFSITGKFLLSFGSEHIFGCPWGLAVNSRNNIIVTDFKKNVVQVFDDGGVFLYKVQDHEIPIQSPAGVTCDSDDNILLCDRSNHRIQLYDREGMILSYFGRKGSGNGDMKYPTDVIISKTGFVVVCDAFNHRIQRF